MRLSSKEDVLNFKPDIPYLVEKRLYLAVTAEGDLCDFVSRFFGPLSGQEEDPVTGSAHCVLAPIWADILRKRTFIARQISSRGGQLEIELGEDRSSLTLSGQVGIKNKITIDL
jgi:predicted PhzF superfamily epimerase YddE/YHI9